MNAKSASGSIVGEWMWGSTIAESGPDGALKILSRCAEMGITDVYLLVKGTGGKLGYRQTKHTDLLLRTERDILREAVNAAHSFGIRLHAWICSMEDSAYKNAHPEAGMRHYSRGRDNDRINLCDPGYRAHMADIAAELAAYEIDGLHFDYIRYNHLANGWSRADFDAVTAMGADAERIRELIETTFGYNGRAEDSTFIFNAYRNGDRDALLVAEYRRRMVREYASTVISAARSVRPDLIVSAAVMPEGAYDEAFASLHYGQDYRDAAALYDYICPMAYSTGYGKDETWVRTVAENAIRMGNRVVMGLQAFGGVSSARLMGETASLRSLALEKQCSDGMRGVVFFRSSQFDYARITCREDGLDVKTVSGTGRNFHWVQLDMPVGARITGASVGEGVRGDTAVCISPDGASVRFFAEDGITEDGEGMLHLRCEGDFASVGQVPFVRAGGKEESTVYTVIRYSAVEKIPPYGAENGEKTNEP